MINIIALISIILLGAIIFLLVLCKPKTILEILLLGVYSSSFVYELTMLITAKKMINNHFIANIHTLVFGIGVLLVLAQIRQHLIHQKTGSSTILISIAFYLFMWFSDNFFLHSIHTFNPLSQSLIFSINLGFAVYLLSIVVLLDGTPFKKSVEGLLILGFMLYSANGVIVDFFFNYYMHLSNDTYLIISTIGISVSTLSHLIVLSGAVGLVRRKKKILRTSVTKY